MKRNRIIRKTYEKVVPLQAAKRVKKRQLRDVFTENFDADNRAIEYSMGRDY